MSEFVGMPISIKSEDGMHLGLVQQVDEDKCCAKIWVYRAKRTITVSTKRIYPHQKVEGKLFLKGEQRL